MKQSTVVFWRTVRICAAVTASLTIVTVGIAESYREIRRFGYGDYENAIAYHDGTLRILDFEISL